MQRLAVVNCLPMTPFTESGKVDEGSLRRLIDHVIEGGVGSVIAVGRAGAVMYLSMEERVRIMDVVMDQVRGRIPAGFGIIDAAYDEGMAVGRAARDAGADFVMSRPPVDGDIKEYYRRLAGTIPVIIYDQGVQRDLDIAGDIVPLVKETGNVVGAKISGEPAKIYEAKLLLDIPVLAGWEVMSLLAYQMGADGVTSASASLFPREHIEMHELAGQRRWDEARDLFYGKLLPIMNYLPGGPNKMGWSVLKHILHWQGIIDTPVVRSPSLPASEAHLEEARQLLRRVGQEAAASAGE